MKFARRRQNYIFEVFAGVVRCGYEHSLFSMSELLVILSVYNSPRRELRDNGVAKNLQFWPQSFGVVLEFSYLERGLFLWNFWGIFKDNTHLKFLMLSSDSLQVVANRFKSLGFSLCFTQKTVNGSEPFFPVMKLVSPFALKPLGSFFDSWERKNGTYHWERLKCFPLLFKGLSRQSSKG